MTSLLLLMLSLPLFGANSFVVVDENNQPYTAASVDVYFMAGEYASCYVDEMKKFRKTKGPAKTDEEIYQRAHAAVMTCFTPNTRKGEKARGLTKNGYLTNTYLGIIPSPRGYAIGLDIVKHKVFSGLYSFKSHAQLEGEDEPSLCDSCEYKLREEHVERK